MIALLAPSSGWCVQFEGPQEVVDLLEDATDGEDLEHQVLDALNVVSVTQFAFNDKVVSDGNATSSVLQERKENYRHIPEAAGLTALLTLTNPRL